MSRTPQNLPRRWQILFCADEIWFSSNEDWESRVQDRLASIPKLTGLGFLNSLKIENGKLTMKQLADLLSNEGQYENSLVLSLPCSVR